MMLTNKRYPIDLSGIFRAYGGDFLKNHTLCLDQQKAFRAISQCRTASLGGHVDQCNRCKHTRIAYNSCRNRHCNKCQYVKQIQWVDQLESRLPICGYYHAVFTIPASLHGLFYLNQRLCYHILFKASSEALMQVARSPQHLGAETGAVAVLHTWGQALTYHPHVHMLIPAGGLSSDGAEWIGSGRKFFLPVRVLSKIFRAIMWHMLAREANKLRLPQVIGGIHGLKQQVYKKDWNVYLKKPIAGPKGVVRYLGRYTHRVAISNSRLLSMEGDKVTFSWKDYRKRLPTKQLLTLKADDFINRFMHHVLPGGFYKIRYYGLLASVNKDKLEKCYSLLGKSLHTTLFKGLSASTVWGILQGKDLNKCTECGKGMMEPKTILDPV